MRAEAFKLPVWSSFRCGDGSSVVPYVEHAGHIMNGLATSCDDQSYPIYNGVPCFLRGDLRPDFSEFEARYGSQGRCAAAGQTATVDHARTIGTFSDKWRKFRNYGCSAEHQDFLFPWFCKKLNVADVEGLKNFYRGKKFILECGPGSGFNSRFMAEHSGGHVFAADISDAAFTTFENTCDLPNCHVVQSDLMELPFADGTFDFVIADGVLHHTPNTKAAVFALYEKVRPGGQFFFYVYKKMGAARQFCDAQIRSLFSELPPSECYKACEGLTEMGRELSKLNAKITLMHGVPSLGIPPGTHDVQRLVYYNFVKCFWNDAFDWETNNMVNFDWYHPVFAWQHTESEIAEWLEELGVVDCSFNKANPNGISVLLRKPE